MGILKETLKDQIKAESTQNYKGTSATVLHYNNVTNTANIEFTNPNGGGTFKRDNVPIAETLGGLCGSGIKDGTKCTIDFINGNLFAPIITGIVGSFYKERTNTNQGAFIVGEQILDTEIIPTEEIEPMCEQWIDEENERESKYSSEYMYPIISQDPMQKSFDIIRDVTHYSNEEQGITNLSNKSTVKIRENGDIEMFVDHNTGIRISKKNQKIYVYGLSVTMINN